jgi:polyhydroxybutyrate depolymerase
VPIGPIQMTARFPLPLLLLAWACRSAFGGEPPPPRTLVVGGVERHYLLLVPASYNGTKAVPLVFVFHGKNNDGAMMYKGNTFVPQAEARGMIAVFPDGLDHQWNGGRVRPASRDEARSDDVAFVSAMIDELSARYRVDPRRIYATGSSNGAIFCHTLGARLSDRIAAIGPVNGALGEAIKAKYPPRSPVSVISFNGTDDPLVPYRGTRGFGDGVFSAPDTIAFWVGADGCRTPPQIVSDPPSPLDGGLSIIRLLYSNGAADTEVNAFIIGHGGHTWPGAYTDPTWAKTAGKTAMSIDATTLIFDFFERHPKP